MEELIRLNYKGKLTALLNLLNLAVQKY